MSRLYAIFIVLAGFAIASSSGAAPTRGAAPLVKPRTLVVERGGIDQFAQDGNFIAWIGGRHYKVHVRGVSRKTGWVVGTAAPGRAVGAEGPSALALGGKRAVWVNVAGVMSREAAIRTAKPGQGRPTLVDTPTVTDYGGTYLAGVAADGEKTIVYGEATVKCEVGDGCAEYSLRGGGVHRILGSKWYPPRIAGIPPAFAIAASQGRVAVVPDVVTDPSHGLPEAAPDGPVEVFTLSGQRVAHVVPAGTVREVALAWPKLAMLVKRAGGTTVIERYDARSGELLTATDAPGASNLAIGTGATVFLVGNRIYTLRGGRPALLWRSSVQPTGLSIEGRRVAWADAVRIRALNLRR